MTRTSSDQALTDSGDVDPTEDSQTAPSADREADTIEMYGADPFNTVLRLSVSDDRSSMWVRLNPQTTSGLQKQLAALRTQQLAEFGLTEMNDSAPGPLDDALVDDDDGESLDQLHEVEIDHEAEQDTAPRKRRWLDPLGLDSGGSTPDPKALAVLAAAIAVLVVIWAIWRFVL